MIIRQKLLQKNIAKNDQRTFFILNCLSNKYLQLAKEILSRDTVTNITVKKTKEIREDIAVELLKIGGLFYKFIKFFTIFQYLEIYNDQLRTSN